MRHANTIRIMIFGQTDAELAKRGIRLKPLHEVRLNGEGKELLDAALKKKAELCLRRGDFASLETLGMPGEFYKEAIADVAQRYQKKTCHDFHLSELGRLGGFTPFETAMIVLDAAEKLTVGENPDAGSRIQNSTTVAQKIADGLPEGERMQVLARIGEIRSAKPRQHDYCFTHYVDEQGVRKPKNDG